MSTQNMGKDYVLFLHGVNVRELPGCPDDRNFPTYADRLFELIRGSLKRGATPCDVEKIALYYGDLNMHEEQSLLTFFHSSPEWERFWFRHARETILLQIIGDIALYVNPYVAARIVERLHQAVVKLREWEQEQQEPGRLHLVCHSLGTIILFDALFASRWESEEMPGYHCITELRDALCGAGTEPEEGIQVASIHTMGSPIPLFSLLDMSSRQQENGAEQYKNTHEIGPKLQLFLQHLAQSRGGKRPIRPADEIYNVSGAFNKHASLRAVAEKASLQVLHLCSVSRKPDDHLVLFRDHVLNGVTQLFGAKHTLRANVACRAHSA